jgi:hypothetical protein
MRCARNREAIDANTQCVADLTLNEAAALLMMSSDVSKLMAFARQIEGADPEEIIEICAANDIAVIKNNPFGAKDFSELEEREQLEWHLWTLLFARRDSVEEAAYHAERMQTRGWTLDGWYGDEGDQWRRRHTREMPQSVKDEWRDFIESNRHRSIADVEAEIMKISEEQEQARAAAPRRRRRARRVRAA